VIEPAGDDGVADAIKVLDSWGLIAFFEDEQPAASRMEEILVSSRGSGTALLMSVVNLGEVWYSLARAYSERKADRAIDEIQRLGVDILAAGWWLVREAAAFKARGNIAYADCFALALAKMHEAALITGDPKFRQFEGKVRIHWL
jgi:ribonuclease VapC